MLAVAGFAQAMDIYKTNGEVISYNTAVYALTNAIAKLGQETINF